MQYQIRVNSEVINRFFKFDMIKRVHLLKRRCL